MSGRRTPLDGVRHILTHSHAAAQCRDWLSLNLPQALVTEGGSTAAAAAEVADPQSRFDAAICAPVAGELHGLSLLADGIADNPDAVTRFVVVSKPGQVGPTTGADKTTMVLFMRENHPGALLEILEQFASRGVNLCRIESRPTKKILGDYCFSSTTRHIDDARGRGHDGLNGSAETWSSGQLPQGRPGGESSRRHLQRDTPRRPGQEKQGDPFRAGRRRGVRKN